MQKIFYRFNDEIYIDYIAVQEWAKDLGVDQTAKKDILQMRKILNPHRGNQRLLLAN